MNVKGQKKKKEATREREEEERVERAGWPK